MDTLNYQEILKKKMDVTALIKYRIRDDIIDTFIILIGNIYGKHFCFRISKNLIAYINKLTNFLRCYFIGISFPIM